MIAVLVYILAGFFLAPPIVKHQLTEVLSDTLQRPVAIEKVRINPLTLSATIQDFRLTEEDGANIARFDRLYVNFQLITSPFHRAWTFREISLTNPTVDLVRLENGDLNLQQLVPPSPEAEEEPGDIPSLLFRKLAIAGGEIHITDRIRQPVYTKTLAPVDIELTDIGTREDQRGHHDLELFSETGARLALQGDLVVNPLAFTGRLEATGPYLPLAYEYIEEQLAIRVDRGNLDLGLDFAIAETADNLDIAIDNVGFAVSDILVTNKDSDAEMLALKRVALTGFRFQWPEKSVAATELTLSEPRLTVVREDSGRFDWQRILPADSESPVREGEDAVESEATDTGTATGNGEETAPPLADWSLSLATLAIDNLGVTLVDRQLNEPAELALRDVSLAVNELSNQSGQAMPATLSAAMGESGRVDFQGDFQLLPDWRFDGDLELADLPLPLFQPYVGNAINARLDSGELSLTATLSGEPDSPFSMTADASLGQLAVVTTADDKPLVSWETLEAPNLQFSAAPAALNTGPVTVRQPYARVTIHEDQSTNFHRLLATETASDDGEKLQPAEQAPAEEPEQPDGGESGDGDAEPFPLTIAAVEIEDGTMDFSDFNLPIPFQEQLSALNGELVDYVTTGTTQASLTLNGQVGDYGEVSVSGQLSPWDFTADTRISLDMQNVEMPDLEPYSIKFVGRKLASGKMDLDLDYTLRDGRLEGTNDIVISQFELGPKVPQEGAMNLPLDLAVALLKGPDGTIDIDLPVSGDTSNPKFSIGSIVLNAFSNLITRAVTAPFRLLGALVGASGDDFDRIYFAAGSAEIDPAQREKLNQLESALQQRPQIALEINGVFHPEADSAALKAKQLDAELEAARTARFGNDSSLTRRQQQLTVMEQLFEQRASEEELETVKSEFIEPEQETLPDEYRRELRRRLLATVEVPPARLEQLAQQRADSIRQQLTASGQLQPDRLNAGDIGEVGKTTDQGVPLKLDISRL